MRARARIGSHPLHPILVVFPLAMWSAGFIFDLIGIATRNPLLWGAGFYAILTGAAGAILAAVAGTTDLLIVVPPRSSAKRRAWLHGSLNTLVLAAFIYVAVRRGDPLAVPGAIALTIEGIAVVLMGYSGWLGGTLVYRNQIGVDHRYAQAGKFMERILDGWDRPVCNQSELADGQMVLANIQGTRVVVGRCSEGYFAFSDHCTHKGGPLSDGSLVGCTVQCPWHGSQFDITTGRVVSGPASHKIETFGVEIRKGEVYVVRTPEKQKKAA